MQELLARLLLLLQYPQDAKLASRVLIVRENIPQKILYMRLSCFYVCWSWFSNQFANTYCQTCETLYLTNFFLLMQILDYLGPIFPTAVVLLWEVEVCSYPSFG